MAGRHVPRVLLAAESLEAGRGGICRVARLMARVLGEEHLSGTLDAAAVALSDRAPVEGLGIPVSALGRSRARFVLAVHAASLSRSHFIYDFLGMARAHCRLPLLRRPYLCWIHGVEVWETTRRDRIAYSGRARTLLAHSAYSRERASRAHVAFSQAQVCWLATESDELPPRRPRGATAPTLLLLGRMDDDAYKGHAELIDAWPSVVAVVPRARLLLAGGGPALESVKQRVAASLARTCIEVRGFIPESEIESVWTEADVFAMPSTGEGFGLVYIEAMRHAIPVIGSIHDAAPEVNVDGETGYNVDLHDPKELVERIVSLLTDPVLARALGENGQRRWAEHFGYSAFRSRFLPILRRFLEER